MKARGIGMKPSQDKKPTVYGDSFEAREHHANLRTAGIVLLVFAGLALALAGVLFFVLKRNQVIAFIPLGMSLILAWIGTDSLRFSQTPAKRPDPVLIIDGKGIAANRAGKSFEVSWEKISRYEVCDPTTTAGHVGDVVALILAAEPLPSSRDRIALSIYRRVPEDEKPLRVSLVLLDHTPEEIAEALEHYKPRNVFALVNII